MVWVAPYLLEGQLDEYYQHHLILVEFLKDCTSEVITSDMLTKIHPAILSWHAEYERYVDLTLYGHISTVSSLYFRYHYARLPAVPLTIHALIHTASDIVCSGPIDITWE